MTFQDTQNAMELPCPSEPLQQAMRANERPVTLPPAPTLTPSAQGSHVTQQSLCFGISAQHS